MLAWPFVSTPGCLSSGGHRALSEARQPSKLHVQGHVEGPGGSAGMCFRAAVAGRLRCWLGGTGGEAEAARLVGGQFRDAEADRQAAADFGELRAVYSEVYA